MPRTWCEPAAAGHRWSPPRGATRLPRIVARSRGQLRAAGCANVCKRFGDRAVKGVVAVVEKLGWVPVTGLLTKVRAKGSPPASCVFLSTRGTVGQATTIPRSSQSQNSLFPGPGDARV